jgi:hypothetical protein
MRYKAIFTVGLAAGYVLGARAGRQRYEQIKRLSKTVSAHPVVKSTTDRVQAQVSQLGTQARQAVQDKAGATVHDLAGKVTGRFNNREISLDADPLYTDPSYANGSMT